MIAIVSSSPQERTALGDLCEGRGWNVLVCSSVRTIKRQLTRVYPRVALLRHQLEDGYADDIIAALNRDQSSSNTKIIVLLSGSATASSEVRLLQLGADCVQRDPIRADVVLAYLAKYVRPLATSRPPAKSGYVDFAGARFDLLGRTLQYRGSVVQLTPREVTLLEVLAESAGNIVTYETLYNDVLGRRFRGDTSNMRVLLGKLGSSFKLLGVTLQEYIDVIPKTGYRYRSAPREKKPASTPS